MWEKSELIKYQTSTWKLLKTHFKKYRLYFDLFPPHIHHTSDNHSSRGIQKQSWPKKSFFHIFLKGEMLQIVDCKYCKLINGTIICLVLLTMHITCIKLNGQLSPNPAFQVPETGSWIFLNTNLIITQWFNSMRCYKLSPA